MLASSSSLRSLVAASVGLAALSILTLSCASARPHSVGTPRTITDAQATGLQLSVTFPSRATIGNPIPIAITLQNTAKTPIDMGWCTGASLAETITLILKNPSGNLPRMKPEGIIVAGMGVKGGPSLPMKLAPGESFRTNYNLSDLYFLEHPGQHLLIISCSPGSENTQGPTPHAEVKSRILIQ